MCLICSEILIVCRSVLVAEFLDWAIIVVVSHSEFPLLDKFERSEAAAKRRCANTSRTEQSVNANAGSSTNPLLMPSGDRLQPLTRCPSEKTTR
jgi:hypothetical protein